MANFKPHKYVSALPGTLEADSVYFVRAGTGFDLYVTNSSGTIVAYQLNSEAISITRADLNALASTSAIGIHKTYLITDENRLAVGLTATTYETYAKQSEAGSSSAPVALQGTWVSGNTLVLPYSGILPELLIVTFNGIRQLPTTHYTISGTTLTFTFTPTPGAAYIVSGVGNYSLNGQTLNSMIDTQVAISLQSTPIFLSGTWASGITLVLPYADIAPQLLHVTLNGIRQAPVTHYTVSGSILTFTFTPDAGLVYVVTGVGNYTVNGTALTSTINTVRGDRLADIWFFGG